MNKNHLRIIKMTLSVLLIAGIFNSGSLISEKKIEVTNLNQMKKGKAIIKTLEFETVKTYNSSLPKGSVVTKEEGHTGLAYVNEKSENIEIIESPKNAEIEIGTGDEANYTGKMTGYGADCAGCSGTLSCRTKEGNYHNLTTNGEYYNDSQYGTVRILAAALDKFPCGTMIKVENENLGTFNAIVLDTGGAMRKAWANGTILMDLAFKSENDPAVHLATSSNTKYSIQRWGY